MAARIVLLDYNSVTVNEDFCGVAVGDALLCSDFLGDNDSAKLIDVSYYSCGFHDCDLTFWGGKLPSFSKF